MSISFIRCLIFIFFATTGSNSYGASCTAFEIAFDNSFGSICGFPSSSYSTETSTFIPFEDSSASPSPNWRNPASNFASFEGDVEGFFVDVLVDLIFDLFPSSAFFSLAFALSRFSSAFNASIFLAFLGQSLSFSLYSLISLALFL